jgi:DNA (cytosine-5)-methyltransferase 1
MNFGSLFSGIGGIDLGLERAGMKCLWHVELDDFRRELLTKHWPDVEKYEDVREVGKHNLRQADLICGGFPCPAFSMAGKRGGFEQDDLFYEFVRVADELQPAWVVLENVRGFIKWRTAAIEAFKNIGYDLIDFVLDARDFGVPQARERWFAVGVRRGELRNLSQIRVPRTAAKDLHGVQSYLDATEGGWAPTLQTKKEWGDVYANSRRVRKGYGLPRRMDRLRALGDAVVPQMAEWLGKVILHGAEVE